MKIYLIFLFAALIIANEEGNSDRIYANEWSIVQNKDNNEDSTYAKVNASSTKRLLILMKIPQIVLIPVLFPVLFPILLIKLVNFFKFNKSTNGLSGAVIAALDIIFIALIAILFGVY